MRKLFYVIILGTSLLVVSCAKNGGEELSNTTTVSITVCQPGNIQTRSISDGTTATNLYFGVYQTSSDGTLTNYLESLSSPDGDEYTFDENLETTIELQLVNGNYYTLILWAEAPDAAEIYNLDFSISDGDPSMTIDTDNLISNTEYFDAFYKCYAIGQVTSDITDQTITLTRPFAQVNFGTDDLAAVAAAGVTDITTTLKVEGIFDVLDLYTGEATTSDASTGVTVTYAEADLSLFGLGDTYEDDEEQFPVEGYQYISMTYLLYSSDQGTVNLTLTSAGENFDGHTLEVSQVPVQRNYRTNIYGSLLTSTVDYTIKIDPVYDTEDNTVDADSTGSGGE